MNAALRRHPADFTGIDVPGRPVTVTPTVGCAKYVGRVGMLAAALGVGLAVATGVGAGLAHAEPSSSTGASNDSGNPSSPSTGPVSRADAGAAPGRSAAITERRDAGTRAQDAERTEASMAASGQPAADRRDDQRGSERWYRDRDRNQEEDRDRNQDRDRDRDRDRATVAAPSASTSGYVEPARLSPPQAGRQVSAPATVTDAQRVGVAAIPSRGSTQPTTTAPAAAGATKQSRVIDKAVTASTLTPLMAPNADSPFRPSTLWTMVELLGRELQRGFINRRPEVVDQELTLHVEDATGAIPIALRASDPNGDALGYGVAAPGGLGGPARGTVSVDPATGNLVYRPDSDFAAVGGTDSFGVTVFDNVGGVHYNGLLGGVTRGLQDMALVTVTLPARFRPTPAPPRPNPDTPTEPNPPTGQFTIDDTDPATGTATGSIDVPNPGGGTLTFDAPAETSRGTIEIDEVTGRFTYTPTDAARHAAAANGATDARRDTFAVTVTDSAGRTTTVPVTVDITPANARPDGSFTVVATNPDTGLVSGAVTGTDADDDALVYSAPATTERGTVRIDSATGVFTFTPTAEARHAAAATGATDARQATFDVTVDDGYGGTTVVPVTVDISPANTPPTATADFGTPDPGTGAVSGTITVIDADGDAPTFSAPTSTAYGTVTIDPVTGAFTYTPTEAARQAAAESGGTGGTGFQTITLTESGSVTQGTFDSVNNGLVDLSQLGEGGVERNYVATFFTAAETRRYYFGQTSAPADTVMVLYNGVFDPASPAANAIALNDDTSSDSHAAVGAIVEQPYGCGSTNFCPQVNVELAAGQTISLVVTTYRAYEPLGLPQTFYASGSGSFSSTALFDTFNVTVDDGHGGVVTIPVTVPIDPMPTATEAATEAL
ncbi:Ig-like domain-containing protein [Mycobacterium sp. WMMD1722]|uniref:Ig-like domain-containing protein n=1 Tax=Mycobacterium sp. WMMD1722 TaxID=3404117 RepID=UPI003BF4E08C